jgi:hypothetical protein
MNDHLDAWNKLRDEMERQDKHPMDLAIARMRFEVASALYWAKEIRK